jgi:hypothetical protein
VSHLRSLAESRRAIGERFSESLRFLAVAATHADYLGKAKAQDISFIIRRN